MNKYTCSILTIILLTLLTGCSNTESEDPANHSPIQEQALSIGISFPPLVNISQQNITLPLLNDLNVTKIRISESWKTREISPGVYNWAPLDARINFVTQNNLSLLLTIESVAPTWESSATNNELSGNSVNEENFRNYINILLQRYANKIDKIQFGNEWDAWAFYLGSASDFVKFNNILYTQTKLYSPQTTVVLGGVTAAYPFYIQMYQLSNTIVFPSANYWVAGKTPQTFTNYFLNIICPDWENKGLEARMNYVFQNAQYDEVDVHLYDWPENWPMIIDKINDLTNKPILVSEFGTPNPDYEVYTQAYQAQRLATCLSVLQTLPIIEAYHFLLVDSSSAYHNNNGLLEAGLQAKPAYNVFKTRN